jgi:hypothetical protein
MSVSMRSLSSSARADTEAMASGIALFSTASTSAAFTCAAQRLTELEGGERTEGTKKHH